MRCPHCNKTLKLSKAAELNASSLDCMVIAKTKCCGKGVSTSPIRTYTVKPVEGPGTDDWGYEFK
jgi:hypothetical protein